MPVNMRRNLCFALAGAAFLQAVVTVADAAQAAPEPRVTKWRVGDVPPGTTALDELDEVLVWTRRAAIAIADLEDDYYKRYNKLNKNNNYDVHCSYINTDPDNPGSLLRARICMPEFLIDAMSEWAEGRCDVPDFTQLDLNKDHSLSVAELAGNKQLRRQLDHLDSSLDINHDGRITFVEFQERAFENPEACYQPPPPEAVLVARTDRWYTQMLQVTRSDPDLSKMADNLGDLYGQLRVLQKQAGKLEAEELARKARR